MPIYEYECQQCQHTFEKLVMTEDAVECPECQSRKLEKLLSVPAKTSAATAGLPMACKSSGPPCGPACARW